jgi:formamidopyrimidine-DNA glycosylase
MPELPDVVVYVEALGRRILGHTLKAVRIRHLFLLRSVAPPIDSAAGRKVVELRRLGKRIAIGLEDDFWLVLHLMIAGRLHWREAGVKINRRLDLASFDFDNGSLLLTEAGTQKRASLHLVSGTAALANHDPGGLELAGSSLAQFRARLTESNHTLKRALTNPRLFSGIGNAYSDEILHSARLSPVALTQKLSADEFARLHRACLEVLEEWTKRLRREAADDFPEGVTAFREEMAVHGRFGLPCPDCKSPVQRIRYASNETNYCARCQTGGKLLADRALSRLLKQDWPKTLEEWEAITSKRSTESS